MYSTAYGNSQYAGVVKYDEKKADLLYNATTIHLQGQWKNVSLHSVGQNSFLYLRPMFEQLLDHLHEKINKL